MSRKKKLQENAELTSQEKLEIKKKKKKKKTALIVTFSIIGVVVIFIGYVVISARQAMKTMMNGTVTLENPTRGELVSDITVTGTIESEKTIHYNAPDSILIDTISPVGTYVKKGDPILVFDEDSYKTSLREAELKSASNTSSYEGTLAKNKDTENKYYEARNRYQKYSKLVDEQTAVVDKLNTDITDNNAHWASKLREQITISTNEINTYQHDNKTRYATITAIGYTMTAEDEAWLTQYENYIYERQQLISNCNNQLDALTNSATAYDNQKTISDATALLTEYKTEKATAESEMKTYKSAIANDYDKESLEISNELSTIQNQNYYSSILEYADGLIAPFDGVVTVAGYTDDDTTVAGAPLITFSSLDDLHVTVGVTKTDLESLKEGQDAVIKVLGNTYKGKVRTINRMVTQSGNSSQVMVTVSIDNPDDNMYLGLDAKCTITLANLNDCLKVPVESVNIDNTGEFVFTMDPKTMIVGKKYVETGVSSDFYIEILSGLDESDVVITTYTGTITEGMPAMVSPDSMSYIQVGE
ncbi:MAG: efflux RND transporter periplasmic adaptor subunit [Lachnospiraceae bacterium]|nr:efflux RND transporter periplasmic adaptor subunit [Lachnospiraceae bacterium]